MPLLRGSPARLSVVVTGGAGQVAGPAGAVPQAGPRAGRPRDRAARPRRPAGQRPPRRGRGRCRALGGRARRGRARLRRAAAGRARAPAGSPRPTRWPRPSCGSSSAPAGSRPTSSRPRRTLARWIDAALDRETPFKCTAGMHDAAAPPRPRDRLRAPRLPQRADRHRPRLRRLCRDEVAAILDEPDDAALIRLERATRTWSGGGAGSPRSAPARSSEPLETLVATGLLEDA